MSAFPNHKVIVIKYNQEKKPLTCVLALIRQLRQFLHSISSLAVFLHFFHQFLYKFYISSYDFLNIHTQGRNQRYHKDCFLNELDIVRCFGHRKESYFCYKKKRKFKS